MYTINFILNLRLSRQNNLLREIIRNKFREEKNYNNKENDSNKH
jgi:hypothetical protein